MEEQEVYYQVGDQVIHWRYGLGEIIQLDEKELSGHTGTYYVVQMPDLTLWVPLNKTGVQSLRPPTPAKEFKKLFRILAGPGEALATDRHARKTQLMELLKDGSLASICRVVRDLASFKKTNSLNENDNSIMERARNLLLKEWGAVLSIPIHQAEFELGKLLESGTA